MTFFAALPIAEANSVLIGRDLNGERVDEILIVPTNPDKLKSFIDLYIQIQNPQQAIAPFLNDDVKVVALFRKDYLFKLGVLTTIDL